MKKTSLNTNTAHEIIEAVLTCLKICIRQTEVTAHNLFPSCEYEERNIKITRNTKAKYQKMGFVCIFYAVCREHIEYTTYTFISRMCVCVIIELMGRCTVEY